VLSVKFRLRFSTVVIHTDHLIIRRLFNCLPFRSTWVHPRFGVRVTRSLVLCVCYVDRCLSFCPFSFGHCVVCPSSIYGFRFLITPLLSPNSSYKYDVWENIITNCLLNSFSIASFQHIRWIIYTKSITSEEIQTILWIRYQAKNSYV
jgi:hypothetical protein